MIQDRIQWENIPDEMMERWLSAYELGKWPFNQGDKHAMNREKIAKIYSEIHRSDKKRLPQDPYLKTLHNILHKSECAVFDDAKLKNNINNKETAVFKTCEIAVRDINGFIKSL